MHSDKPVLAAQSWAGNAALIFDLIRLGYLHGNVLDPTYGDGKWWLDSLWTDSDAPGIALTKHDLYKLDGVDYRELPEDNNTYDSVAFDPPYVSIGGRLSTGIPEFHARYGTIATPKSPRALYEYNQAGFWECVRVVKKGGYVCFKSQDYISSGKLQPVTHWILSNVLDTPDYERKADVDYVDRLEHVGHSRPQPKGRRQLHARRNLSTMLVFQKR